jgi:hypothetical protein
MTARREQIILEVLARLAAVPAAALVLRQPNAQPTTSYTLTLDDRGQRLVEAGAIHNRFDMTLVIGGYVSGQGATAAAAVNEFYAETARALFADGMQLGGIAELVTEGDLSIDAASVDQDFTTFFELLITVQFIARTHDPALI